jgi:RNA polymerase sigma-70 factor (ECF subfamily)
MSQKKNNICNENIFKKVYDTLALDLRNFLIYKFQDLESAEDVVQESFIKLWHNCEKVSFIKAKSFLFTIANNMFLNIKKHEKIVREFEKKSNQSKYNSISPEYIMIEEEYAQKLENAINALPEKQKEVFRMSRIEKLKYHEIADKLQVSVKTVEKRMSDALRFLRTQLEYFK